METEKRTFRSRLNTLPLEMKCELGEVPFQKGMLATSRKNRCIEILKKYDIPFLEVGTGTNRFIIKYDGYVIKIALDNEGVADNKQEWVMSSLLGEDVATSHEISSGGHLLVATYAPAFTAYSEMMSYQSNIRKILTKWSGRFLLGDVGLARENYANWGLFGTKPVCIDYAYIFPSDMNLFKCHCGSRNLGHADTTFTNYRCRDCGMTYEDREIRARISQNERLRLFDTVEGFRMTRVEEEFDVPLRYVQLPTDPDYPDPNRVAQAVIDKYGGI